MTFDRVGKQWRDTFLSVRVNDAFIIPGCAASIATEEVGEGSSVLSFDHKIVVSLLQILGANHAPRPK